MRPSSHFTLSLPILASPLSRLVRFVAYTNLPNCLRARTTVDLRVEYSASRRPVPFVQLRNLFNEPFTNDRNGFVLNARNYHDPKLEFGLRGIW